MDGLVFKGFDWDASNGPKIQKTHGVAKADVEHALTVRIRTVMDRTHSHQEPRYIAIGFDRAGRPLFVAFTIRLRDGKALARPISARYMHSQEFKRHEQS